jgi:hypothetical protein
LAPKLPQSLFVKEGFLGVEIGGHPQTLGRDESLHSLRISDLGIGYTVKELFAPTYS